MYCTFHETLNVRSAPATSKKPQHCEHRLDPFSAFGTFNLAQGVAKLGPKAIIMFFAGTIGVVVGGPFAVWFMGMGMCAYSRMLGPFFVPDRKGFISFPCHLPSLSLCEGILC